MKKFLLAGLLLCAFGFAACSDDDDSQEDNAKLMQELIENLCNTTVSSDGTITYEAKYGSQNELDPSTYYLLSTFDENALDFFEYMVPSGEDDKIVVKGDVRTYTIKGYGSMTYTYIGGDSEVATIEVDFDVISNIKEFVFLTESGWGENPGTPSVWPGGTKLV